MIKVLKKSFNQIIKTLLIILLVSSVFACQDNPNDGKIEVIDSNGNSVYFNNSPERVIILQESLTHCWALSGGTFIGTTDDYVECNRINIDDSVTLVGTSKQPNMSIIMSLSPDLIIYTDKNKQKDTVEKLKECGYKCFCCHIDTFEDYLHCLKQFCILNNTVETAYKTYGTDVEKEINNIINKVPNENKIDVMFMRARNNGYDIYSSGNFVCEMLDKLNCNNIAKDENGNKVGLDQPISLSYACMKNPKYCFITYMGATTNEKVNLIDSQINESIFSNSLWLDAELDKTCEIIRFSDKRDLFQFKPNNRWAEAYQYLFDIIYGDEEN